MEQTRYMLFDLLNRVSGVMLFVGTIVVVLGAVFLYRRLRSAAAAYRTFRGPRVVTCPETHRPAGVEVEAAHAAATALRGGRDLHLKSCSRWPERQGCGQDCLREIESAPEACLVRTLLTRWYAGKECALCHKPFGDIHWHDHRPAMMDPGGRTQAWADLAAENVPDALAADRPVCWSCHIAETFRREFPDLVVDRPWQGPDRHHRML